MFQDVISSPAYMANIDGHPCFFFHFPVSIPLLIVGIFHRYSNLSPPTPPSTSLPCSNISQGLVFKHSGTFRLSFYFFEASSFPAQPAPPALPASSSSFEQPSGRISIAQAKCFSKSVLTVPPLSSEDESADAGAGAGAV